MAMAIGILKETKVKEYRVALDDSQVARLVSSGIKVFVEKDAGLGVGIGNHNYIKAGATVLEDPEELISAARVVIKVKEPTLAECKLLKPNQILFCYLHLAAFPEQTRLLCESGVTAVGYETVTSSDGQLPLLKPMSQIAGRLAVQNAVHFLQKHKGGRGVLMSGVGGVERGKILIIGGGTAGENAAAIGLGLGAQVTIFDRSLVRLDYLADKFGANLNYVYPTNNAYDEHLSDADIVIGSVLIPGASAPKLVSRDMIGNMKEGAVIADIAIDQGGCIETSRPTSHDDPTYIVDNVIHYCVANIPSAVPLTSTKALSNSISPYVQILAETANPTELVSKSHPLKSGVNVYNGDVCLENLQ